MWTPRFWAYGLWDKGSKHYQVWTCRTCCYYFECTLLYKIEPGVDSILEYDPLAENIEVVQMKELMIKTVEADLKTQEISNEVSKTWKTGQKVRDPLETSQPTKSTKKQFTKASEKDPLGKSQACCHICQAETPGLMLNGDICCYSCRWWLSLEM